jgi:hypothetical protein
MRPASSAANTMTIERVFDHIGMTCWCFPNLSHSKTEAKPFEA